MKAKAIKFAGQRSEVLRVAERKSSWGLPRVPLKSGMEK